MNTLPLLARSAGGLVKNNATFLLQWRGLGVPADIGICPEQNRHRSYEIRMIEGWEIPAG
jgi:hypothetical protein